MAILKVIEVTSYEVLHIQSVEKAAKSIKSIKSAFFAKYDCNRRKWKSRKA